MTGILYALDMAFSHSSCVYSRPPFSPPLNKTPKPPPAATSTGCPFMFPAGGWNGDAAIGVALSIASFSI